MAKLARLPRRRPGATSRRALDYLLHAPKGERVRIRYRQNGRERSYEATFEGVLPNLQRRYRETDSEWVKSELEKFMVERPCPACGGRRLKPEVLSVTVDERTSRTSHRCR